MRSFFIIFSCFFLCLKSDISLSTELRFNIGLQRFSVLNLPESKQYPFRLDGSNSPQSHRQMTGGFLLLGLNVKGYISGISFGGFATITRTFPWVGFEDGLGSTKSSSQIGTYIGGEYNFLAIKFYYDFGPTLSRELWSNLSSSHYRDFWGLRNHFGAMFGKFSLEAIIRLEFNNRVYYSFRKNDSQLLGSIRGVPNYMELIFSYKPHSAHKFYLSMVRQSLEFRLNNQDYDNSPPFLLANYNKIRNLLLYDLQISFGMAISL